MRDIRKLEDDLRARHAAEIERLAEPVNDKNDATSNAADAAADVLPGFQFNLPGVPDDSAMQI